MGPANSNSTELDSCFMPTWISLNLILSLGLILAFVFLFYFLLFVNFSVTLRTAERGVTNKTIQLQLLARSQATLCGTTGRYSLRSIPGFPVLRFKSEKWDEKFVDFSVLVFLTTVFVWLYFALFRLFIVRNYFKICLYEMWGFKKNLAVLLVFTIQNLDHQWLVPSEKFKILCQLALFPLQLTVWLFCFYICSIGISHQVIKVVDSLFIIFHSKPFVEAVDSFCVLGCENWRHESVHRVC